MQEFHCGVMKMYLVLGVFQLMILDLHAVPLEQTPYNCDKLLFHTGMCAMLDISSNGQMYIKG